MGVEPTVADLQVADAHSLSRGCDDTSPGGADRGARVVHIDPAKRQLDELWSRLSATDREAVLRVARAFVSD